jgi:hypothetical protein
MVVLNFRQRIQLWHVPLNSIDQGVELRILLFDLDLLRNFLKDGFKQFKSMLANLSELGQTEVLQEIFLFLETDIDKPFFEFV